MGERRVAYNTYDARPAVTRAIERLKELVAHHEQEVLPHAARNVERAQKSLEVAEVALALSTEELAQYKAAIKMLEERGFSTSPAPSTCDVPSGVTHCPMCGSPAYTPGGEIRY